MNVLSASILGFLHRHVTGDWGDVPDEDAQANEDSQASGYIIQSLFDTGDGLLSLVAEPAKYLDNDIFPSGMKNGIKA